MNKDEAKQYLRDMQDARAELAAEDFRQPGPEEAPGSLADSLARPRPPVRYLVEGLLGARHNLSIEALYKTGKTALLASLCGSLADGRPFLGFAQVTPPAGAIGVWNLEMDADDFDDYLAAEVRDASRIGVAHLRGRPVPFMASRPGRQWTIDWLKRGCSVWVIDTWSRLCAWNGVDPLDNAGVARLTAAVDEVKAAAGIETVVVTTHMPHAAKADTGNERAYGAQTFSGWVDGMWRYVRNDEGRFLSADGRKIWLDECQVLKDAYGRLVAQAGDRKAAARTGLSYLVISFVREHPGSTTNAVAKGVGKRAADVAQVLHEAEKGSILRTKESSRNSTLWFP